MRRMRKRSKNECRSAPVIILCMVLCSSMLFAGCNGQEDGVAESTSQTQSSVQNEKDLEITDLVGTPSDYSAEDNWMKIPEITHEIDTFYIYPTCYADDSADAKPICDINHTGMREGARQVYEDQATVYEESTNVFAPFYRQSNIFTVADMSNEELDQYHRNEQRTDIYAALDYYFENYNDERPFIIAGHSQGSIMIKIVLGEYMEAHPEYYERMVAAYPIGYSITTDWLEEHPSISFAESADDTEVVVSWNTEGPGNKGHKNLVVDENAISINPINWKRDDTYASFEENQGSRILNEAGEYEIVKGLADAQIDTERGVVVCTSKEVTYSADSDLFGPESLHGSDYSLYYENLRENVAARVESYLRQVK